MIIFPITNPLTAWTPKGWYGFLGSLLGLLVLMSCVQETLAQDREMITIGMVTGQLESADSFGPFTGYLQSRLPGRDFRVEDFESLTALTRAVNNRTVDFAFVSPAAYVELALTNTPRILATITQPSGDAFSPWLAGAVFVRGERSDINTLADARGKRVVALSELALGGWLSAAREWKDLGVDVERDFAALDFLFSYTDIIDAVCSGEADVGVIAANTLAGLRSRCRDPLKILPPPLGQDVSYPVPHSTRLYPELAFVMIGSQDETFVHDLTVALLDMPVGGAAANAVFIAGFTPALLYNDVQALMRELRIGPFNEFGALSIRDFLLDNIYPAAFLVLVIFLMISAGFFYALQMSRKLRQAENYRKRVFEGSQIAMVVVDAENKVFYDMNQAAVRLYGYKSKEELVGKSLLALSSSKQDINSSIPAAINDIADKVFKDGGVTFSWRHVRPSGEEWIGRIYLMAFDYSDNKLIQATVEDITEESRREQERQDLAQQLEFSQRMESIGRLAGGIAHDFNNLLTIINGYCDLLLLDTSDTETTKVIQQISRAGLRAADLTQQLLTFSRRQANRYVPVDLNDIISESADMTKSMLGEDMQLALQLHDSPCRVLSDPGQLHQVLLNLVVNAKDAMMSGGTLTITTNICDINPMMATTLKLQPGKYVEMKVTDTGIGMEDKILQHIFEPFFTTKEHSGTGLGLSTVYGIVQQSQGIIQVDSIQGSGTTFRVLIPLTEQQAQTSTQPRVGTATNNNSFQILVVEDQDDVRNYICSVLKKANYQVMSVASGKQALALMNTLSQPVSLLLTDVVMDGMSGGELAEIFKKQYPGIPILFISGYPEDEIARRGVRQGDMAFLAKPFTPGELLERIASILRETTTD